MTDIGFIGLGKIGMPISKHLIDGGHRVVGYRRSPMTDFQAIGGVPAASADQVGAQAELVFTCVYGDAAMDEVMGHLLETAHAGQVIVCLSSHSVAVKQGYADALAAKGATLLDAEVSGTPGMVVARKASVYLAGPEAESRKAEAAVRCFADQVFYLGEFGSATKVKLINNFLVALDIAGAAQAMAIALNMGIDPALMINAVGKGSGGSTQFNIRAAWMAERRFLPIEGLPAVLLSYLNRVKAAGDDAGASTELVDNLIDIYQRAIPVVGERDVAAMIELFETNRPN